METAWAWAVLALLATALGWILTYIGGGLRSVETALRELVQQASRLTIAVGTLTSRVDGHDARLLGIEGKLEQHDTRFDGIESKLEQHDARFDGIESKLDEHLRRHAS